MSDRGLDALFIALTLILPLSALAARRLPLGETFRMVLAWVAIFGLLFVLAALWQAAFGTGSILSGLL